MQAHIVNHAFTNSSEHNDIRSKISFSYGIIDQILTSSFTLQATSKPMHLNAKVTITYQNNLQTQIYTHVTRNHNDQLLPCPSRNCTYFFKSQFPQCHKNSSVFLHCRKILEIPHCHRNFSLYLQCHSVPFSIHGH